MNIWIVNHYAITPQQAGGTRHFTLARELVRRGHEVTIVASSFDHTTRRELHHLPGRELFGTESVDQVRFLWVRTPPYHGNGARRLWNTLVFAHRVRKLIPHRFGGPPDVVLGSSPHLFAAWSAQSLARRLKVPFVLEVRDLWPQSLVDLGNFSESHPFIRLLSSLERTLYRRSHRIVTLLPGAAEHIAAKGADPEKIAWIPNGIDLTSLLPPSPPEPREHLTLMYAGTHGLANGLHVVLEAARRIEALNADPSIRFRFVGDGPDKPRLMAMASAMGLNSVHFEPPVPKAAIHELLTEADAFLMVLQDSPVFRWGVSPNKLFDYMAAARPVLFSVNTPTNPIDAAGAGLTVPAGDPEALARAALQVSRMTPEQRWAMGLRGRRYVEEHHNLRRLAAKLEEVLANA